MTTRQGVVAQLSGRRCVHFCQSSCTLPGDIPSSSQGRALLFYYYFHIHIIEYVLYTPIVKSISIKVATWRRPLVTARQGTNGADNRFQLQMSQLEAAEPSVMQTNGQGRWAVAACEETSIQENLLNCADNTQASGPRALEQRTKRGPLSAIS